MENKKLLPVIHENRFEWLNSPFLLHSLPWDKQTFIIDN